MAKDLIYLRESLFDDLDFDDTEDVEEIEIEKSVDNVSKADKALFFQKIKEKINEKRKKRSYINPQTDLNVIEMAVSGIQFSLLNCLYDYTREGSNRENSEILLKICTGNENSNLYGASDLIYAIENLYPFLINEDDVIENQFSVLTYEDPNIFFDTIYDVYSKLVNGDKKIVMTYSMTAYIPKLISWFAYACDYYNSILTMTRKMRSAKSVKPMQGGFTIDMLFKHLSFSYGFAKIICGAIVNDIAELFGFEIPEVVVKLRLIPNYYVSSTIDLSNINLIGYYNNNAVLDDVDVSLEYMFNYIKSLQENGLLSFGNMRIDWDQKCAEATEVEAKEYFQYIKQYNPELEARPCMLWIDAKSEKDADFNLLYEILDWIRKWMSSESKEWFKTNRGTAYAKYIKRRGPESIEELSDLNNKLVEKFPDLFTSFEFIEDAKQAEQQEKITYQKEALEHKIFADKGIKFLKESMFDDLDIDDGEAELELDIDKSIKNVSKNDLPIFWQAIMSEEGEQFFDDIFPILSDYDNLRGLLPDVEEFEYKFRNVIFLDDLGQGWIEGQDNSMQLQVFLKSVFVQLMDIMIGNSSKNIIHYDYFLSENYSISNLEDFITNLIDYNYFNVLTNDKFLYKVVSRMLKCFIVKNLINEQYADKILKTINWQESKVLIKFDNYPDNTNLFFDYEIKYNCRNYFEKLNRFVDIMSEKSKYFDFSNFSVPNGDNVNDYAQLHIWRDISVVSGSDIQSELMLDLLRTYTRVLSFLANADNKNPYLKTGLIVVNRVKQKITSLQFDKIENKLAEEFPNVNILLFRTLKDFEEFAKDYDHM